MKIYKKFTILTVLLLCTACSKNVVSGTESIILEEEKKTPEEEYNNVFENVDSKEFVPELFHKVTGKELYLDKPAGTQVIPLYVDGDYSYKITIPDYLKVVTDNMHYLYTIDDSVYVSVISGVDPTNLRKSLGWYNVEDAGSGVLICKDSEEGGSIAAKHLINDKAIKIETFDNTTAFTYLLNGLKETKCYKHSNLSLMVEEGTTMVSLPRRETGFTASVTPGFAEGKHIKMYTYESGYLIHARQLRTFGDIKEELLKVAIVVGESTTATRYYERDGMLFAQVGDVYVGVMSVNYNTCLTCFGKGAEAGVNVIEFLNQQEGV